MNIKCLLCVKNQVHVSKSLHCETYSSRHRFKSTVGTEKIGTNFFHALGLVGGFYSHNGSLLMLCLLLLMNLPLFVFVNFSTNGFTVDFLQLLLQNSILFRWN